MVFVRLDFKFVGIVALFSLRINEGSILSPVKKGKTSKVPAFVLILPIQSFFNIIFTLFLR